MCLHRGRASERASEQHRHPGTGTGTGIDANLRTKWRQAAKKASDDADEEAMKNMVWGKGLVQMEEKAALKQRVEDEKLKPFARTIDDKDLNDDLRARDRWVSDSPHEGDLD